MARRSRLLGCFMPIVQRNDSPGSQPVTVVVLSSDEELRAAVAYWFEALSIPTVATADGYEANRALKSSVAGLLITDRLLPPWPGLDSFHRLQSDNSRLCIAYVDDGSWDGAILARIAGATIVLPRPLSRRQVVAALGLPEILA